MSHDIAIVITWVHLHWKELVALVGGAGGLSVLLESVLLKLKNSRWHVDSKKFAFTLLHLFTVLTTVAAYFLSNLKGYDTLPFYGSLVIIAETWHRFVVSGLFNRYIVPFLNFLSSQKSTTTTPVSQSQVEAQPQSTGFVD